MKSTKKYNKTYATVLTAPTFTASGWQFTARTDEFRVIVTLNTRERSGKTSTTQIVPGARIKIYQRPGCANFYFRFVGD